MSDLTRALDCEPVCTKCCYNLRGLAAPKKCPRCGASTAGTLRGIDLSPADPEHIASMAHSMTFILCASLAMLLGFAIMFRHCGRWHIMKTSIPLDLVTGALIILGQMFLWWGVIRLTEHHALKVDGDSGRRPRSRLRSMATIGLCVWPVMMVFVHPFAHGGDEEWWRLFRNLWIVQYVLCICCINCYLCDVGRGVLGSRFARRFRMLAGVQIGVLVLAFHSSTVLTGVNASHAAFGSPFRGAALAFTRLAIMATSCYVVATFFVWAHFRRRARLQSDAAGQIVPSN